MQAVGIIRGAFYFFRPAKDPTKQARNFLNFISSIEPIQPEDLPPALDLKPFPDIIRREWEVLSKTERIKRILLGLIWLKEKQIVR